MNRKRISIFILGPFASGFFSLISLPLMTWLFEPEDIGRLALLVVFLNLSFLFISLGLDQSYIRFYNTVKDKNTLLYNVLTPILLFLFTITVLILLLFPTFLSSMLFDVKSISYSILIILCFYSNLISRLCMVFLRMAEKAIYFAISQSIQKISIIVVLLSVLIINSLLNLRLSFNFTTLLNIVAASWVLTSAYNFLVNKKTICSYIACFRQEIDLKLFRSLLAYSLPLALNSIVFWLLTSVDKISLKALSSLENVGIYSVAMSFAFIGVIFKTAITSVWAPFLYKWVEEKSEVEINDIINQVQSFMVFIVLVIFCFVGIFSWLVTYILPDNYIEIKYFLPACLGYSFMYLLSEVMAVGINVKKKTSLSLIPTVFSLVINLIGNYTLIPEYGANGAAISTFFSFYVFFIIKTEISRYIWLKVNRFNIYIMLLICLVISIFSSLKVFEYKLILIFWFSLLLGTFLLYYKSFVSFILKYLKGEM